MKERELQDKFVLWLDENKNESQHIYEEVDCMWGMTDVILYDGRKNNGYEIGPYDKITEFRVFVGYQYNDIVRAAWREKPTRINGLEGSDQNTIPTKELVLTKPL